MSKAQLTMVLALTVVGGMLLAACSSPPTAAGPTPESLSAGFQTPIQSAGAADADGWKSTRPVPVAMSAETAAPATGDEDDEDMAKLKRRVRELERQAGIRPELDMPDAGEGEGAGDAARELAPGDDDSTGTDPRAFGTKFMPYYRYTKLKNDVLVNEFVLFGLVRFADNFAVTYEIPIAKQIDYSNLREFQNAQPPPSGGPPGGFPPNGPPTSALESDGDVTGMGDAIFRAFYKTPLLRTDSPIVEGGSMEIMPILETTVPTATEDLLGSDSLIVSPGFAFVVDMPFMGFAAMMNFYDFDAWRDDSRSKTNRIRGRWFYMQPLTPPQFMAEKDPEIPDLGLLGGFYLLPELQPMYDFENDDFSCWIAPELGKIFAEGVILYAKPGWTFDPERTDRKFTMEVGFRYFF